MVRLCMLWRLAMSMAGLAGGAAKRRRERQLRSFLRHEELSVKMALARALHHSTQRVEVPREGWRARSTTRHGDRASTPRGRGQPAWRSREGKWCRSSGTLWTRWSMLRCFRLFDVPVPQLVEQLLLDVLSPFDFPCS